MRQDIPAFPCMEERNTSSDPLATPKILNHPGMTLRDYFAGQALVELHGKMPPKDAAWRAYGYADAMLAEREKNRDRA